MRWWRQALIILAGWTLVALVSATQWYWFRASAGLPHSWSEAAARSFPSCWLWAGFTPAILWLARRFRLERGRWIPALLPHGFFSLGFDALDAVAAVTLLGPLLPGPPRTIAGAFLGGSFINIFSYFAVVAVGHAIEYHRLFLEREVTASRLRAELLGAQLRALEMQLRPHFLFNTLHAIASLVRVNRTADAVRMTAGFSDLLRAALRSDGAAKVMLREELGFVERYLEIEGIRFQDRLETRVHADPDLHDALVPALILQPLVENAIRHGIERHSAPGRVQVEATRLDGTLILRVQNSGTGASTPMPVPDGNGVGLSNTRARLRRLYGSRHRFDLGAAADGGAVAQVELPLHRSHWHVRPLQVLIVDDEPLARASIRELLAADPEVELAGECAGGEEALARIDLGPPDILFIDVKMPEVDGLAVLRALAPDRVGAVVFVTAYDQYALSAFELQAVDYLLKPFDDRRFQRTLERAKERVRERRAHRLTRELVSALEHEASEQAGSRTPAYPQRLAVKADGRVRFLDVNQIDWIEAADYCVRIHCGGRYHLHREPMKDLEARLDPRRFFRVHRSAIVNLARITELEPAFHGECLLRLQDGTRLKLSRGRRERLHALLGISG